MRSSELQLLRPVRQVFAARHVTCGPRTSIGFQSGWRALRELPIEEDGCKRNRETKLNQLRANKRRLPATCADWKKAAENNLCGELLFARFQAPRLVRVQVLIDVLVVVIAVACW